MTPNAIQHNVYGPTSVYGLCVVYCYNVWVLVFLVLVFLVLVFLVYT